MTRPVSQSDLPSFDQCPALWHATRVRKLDAGNRYSRIGTACHVACEAVTRAVLGEDSRPLYLVSRAAILAHVDETNIWPDEVNEALDIMDAATADGSAISFYVPAGWTAEPECELSLDAEFRPLQLDGGKPVEDGKIVAYRGRLDRLQWNEETGELEVWDWKTSQDWMSGADVLLDVQARWYSMLALAWFPAAHTVTFKRVMLRLGYTASAKFVRGERWHERIMDRAKVLLRQTNLTLAALPLAEHGGFVMPERFGSWCGNCPIRWKCGAWAQARDVGRRPDTEAPREELARYLGALKSAEAELDQHLREDVLARGPIALGDGTSLGFFPKRSLVLRGTREETLSELRGLGMNPTIEAEVFVPSERKFPGLVRDALERIEPNRGMRDAAAERLLAPATGFDFKVKETEDA